MIVSSGDENGGKFARFQLRSRGLLRVQDGGVIVRSETGHAFYVIGLKNIRIHPSTRYWIRWGFIFFHSEEQIYFFSGFAVEFAGYVWTGASTPGC